MEESGCGTPFSAADRSDSGGEAAADESRVSVEDDGASGVGAAAAAAVSVALARSWASAAHQVSVLWKKDRNIWRGSATERDAGGELMH